MGAARKALLASSAARTEPLSSLFHRTKLSMIVSSLLSFLVLRNSMRSLLSLVESNSPALFPSAGS